MARRERKMEWSFRGVQRKQIDYQLCEWTNINIELGLQPRIMRGFLIRKINKHKRNVNGKKYNKFHTTTVFCVEKPNKLQVDTCG